MQINSSNTFTETTHERGRASRCSKVQALRRSVLSCMLWENSFYEDGKTIADRIVELASDIDPQVVANLAIEARTKFSLRHVPLLLLTVLAKTSAKTPLLSRTIPKVIKRADEISELLAIYWKDGKRPISAQMKKGLASVFNNFDEYQLAKYNRDKAVKLRDVMFMTHPKPSKYKEDLYKRLANKELETPDTWEVALSGGADKKETFERLIQEGKLGYLALLRNLRNMSGSKVDKDLVRKALSEAKGFNNVLPFRFVAAARAVPSWEPMIDEALLRKVDQLPKMKGCTVVLVDVSGSMDEKLSSKSDLTRIDVAASLASIVQGDEIRVFSFSHNLVEVPPRKGMSGVDVIIKSQRHGGTYLRGALTEINQTIDYDRIIIITDEQSHDGICDPKGRGYLINVASCKNGVGYRKWTHIDGFSESVLNYIYEIESEGIRNL